MLDMQDLLKLKANGTVEEVHIVDWFPKHQVPNTGGYRRLDAYLESTLLQMGQEGVCTSGIVQASYCSPYCWQAQHCNHDTHV
jgi:hypothetical protein